MQKYWVLLALRPKSGGRLSAQDRGPYLRVNINLDILGASQAPVTHLHADACTKACDHQNVFLSAGPGGSEQTMLPMLSEQALGQGLYNCGKHVL